MAQGLVIQHGRVYLNRGRVASQSFRQHVQPVKQLRSAGAIFVPDLTRCTDGAHESMARYRDRGLRLLNAFLVSLSGNTALLFALPQSGKRRLQEQPMALFIFLGRDAMAYDVNTEMVAP